MIPRVNNTQTYQALHFFETWERLLVVWECVANFIDQTYSDEQVSIDLIKKIQQGAQGCLASCLYEHNGIFNKLQIRKRSPALFVLVLDNAFEERSFFDSAGG